MSPHTRTPEILIVRHELDMFPPVGTRFSVVINNQTYYTKIIARRCFCAGPDSPHEHYYLDLTEIGKLLDWGTFTKIRIRRYGPTRYALSTRK